MAQAHESYDFIIIGGGTSGSVLASRLAVSRRAPKVLLLEAGGRNDSGRLRSPELRFAAAYTEPELVRQHSTIAQPQLNGRKFWNGRGSGLGGTTAINFGFWTLGSEIDYNEWARLVDDDCWKWEGINGVKERFRKIENLHAHFSEDQARYLSQDLANGHSKGGKVDVSYSPITYLEAIVFAAARETQIKINKDINSGDPVGMGLAPSSFHKGCRTTASSAYLRSIPSNLSISTNTEVARILFEGKTAIGVQTVSGKIYRANLEVIVSSGAFDSPKILLQSGIGPSSELSELSIPVIQDLPAIGRNMRDHTFLNMSLLLTPSDHKSLTSGQSPMLLHKSETVQRSSEFRSLPADTQRHILTAPSYEICFLSNPPPPGSPYTPHPKDRFLTLSLWNMAPQSLGSVTLASANPSAFPIINSGALTHPYDIRAAIECLRHALQLMKTPAIASETLEMLTPLPASNSDEDLLSYWRSSVTLGGHTSGTCKMGRLGDENACVAADFCVFGMQKLRVVDLSVMPLLVSNHTASTAYLIGETAAGKIICAYDLDSTPCV